VRLFYAIQIPRRTEHRVTAACYTFNTIPKATEGDCHEYYPEFGSPDFTGRWDSHPSGAAASELYRSGILDCFRIAGAVRREIKRRIIRSNGVNLSPSGR
jgi:hypothetical protein